MIISLLALESNTPEKRLQLRQLKYSIFYFIFYLLVSKTTQQSEKVTEGTANWTTLQSLALEQYSCKDDTVQVSQKMVGENMMSGGIRF